VPWHPPPNLILRGEKARRTSSLPPPKVVFLEIKRKKWSRGCGVGIAILLRTSKEKRPEKKLIFKPISGFHILAGDDACGRWVKSGA